MLRKLSDVAAWVLRVIVAPALLAGNGSGLVPKQAKSNLAIEENLRGILEQSRELRYSA